MFKTVFIIILVWNILVFVLYGIDKYLARNKKRRIPERNLLLFSSLFGSMGAVLGMLIFNHKTSKPVFRYSVPLLFIVHLVIGYCFLFGII